MSAAKDVLNEAVQTWLVVMGLPDTLENYAAGVSAVMGGISCRECRAPFEGSRYEARRAHWEPFSTKNQHALDHGPMVCPTCIQRILEGCLAALVNHPRFGA